MVWCMMHGVDCCVVWYGVECDAVYGAWCDAR